MIQNIASGLDDMSDLTALGQELGEQLRVIQILDVSVLHAVSCSFYFCGVSNVFFVVVRFFELDGIGWNLIRLASFTDPK